MLIELNISTLFSNVNVTKKYISYFAAILLPLYVNNTYFAVVKNTQYIVLCLTLCVEVPTTPGELRVSDVGKTWVSLEWDQCPDDGGSDITGYTVYCRGPHDIDYKMIAFTDSDKVHMAEFNEVLFQLKKLIFQFFNDTFADL